MPATGVEWGKCPRHRCERDGAARRRVRPRRQIRIWLFVRLAARLSVWASASAGTVSDSLSAQVVPAGVGQRGETKTHLYYLSDDDGAMTGAMVVDSKGGAAAADDSRMTLLSVVLVTLSAVSGLLFGYDTGVVSGAMLVIK